MATMTMRRLSESKAEAELSWLGLDDKTGRTVGYDLDGWQDSIWILHAMYERPDFPVDLSHHELRQRLLAQGKIEPDMIGDINLDEETIDSGVPLGFEEHPGEGWERLPWQEFAERKGFRLGQGVDTPPCFRWFPFRSWPLSIRPPCEGSLDETTLRALAEVLNRHCAEEAEDCLAFYGLVPAGEYDQVTIYRGTVNDVRELVTGADSLQSTPSNIWPPSRSWFVHTNWDLWATRVSGPAELIAAVGAHPDLETLRWPSHSTTLRRSCRLISHLRDLRNRVAQRRRSGRPRHR